MATYRLRWAYRSDHGSWAAGEDVELDAETASFLQRDSPGILESLDAPSLGEPETESLDAPPAHRQVTRAPRKRGV